MPKAHIRNGTLTIPLTDEIREKLDVRDGDELEAHVFPEASCCAPPRSTHAKLLGSGFSRLSIAYARRRSRPQSRLRRSRRRLSRL